MEYKMDKKEVASRLQEILNRNSDRKVNKLIPEDIRQLNICIATLTIPDVVGQSEQLVAMLEWYEHPAREDFNTYEEAVDKYFEAINCG